MRMRWVIFSLMLALVSGYLLGDHRYSAAGVLLFLACFIGVDQLLKKESEKERFRVRIEYVPTETVPWKWIVKTQEGERLDGGPAWTEKDARRFAKEAVKRMRRKTKTPPPVQEYTL